MATSDRGRRLLATPALLLAGLFMVVTGCGGGSTSSNSSSSSSIVIKVGTGRDLVETFMADLARFTSKYGVNVTVIPSDTSYTEFVQGVSRGDYDIATIGYPQLASAIDTGLTSDVKVVAGFSAGGQNIVVRKGVTVSSWCDLQGKKVGSPLSTGTGIVLQIILKQNHCDLSKIQLIQGGFTGTPELQALQTAQWDAITYWEPIPAVAVVGGYAYRPQGVSMTDIPGNGLMLAGPKLLKNRSLMVNFMKGYVDAMEYYRQNPAVFIKNGSQFTGLSDTVTKQALSDIGVDYRVDLTEAKTIASYGTQFGFTKSDVSGRVADGVDLSFLAAATGKSQSELSGQITFQPVVAAP
jgi:ABC-type nitrate/sulfonate/bicarbonate transport system substrate-binding protein